jgi:hypothetical protein
MAVGEAAVSALKVTFDMLREYASCTVGAENSKNVVPPRVAS